VDDGSEKIVVELKATGGVGERDRSQLQTYLRLLGISRGFLINFPKNEPPNDDIEFEEILLHTDR